MDNSVTPAEMKGIEERAERFGVSKLLLMESAGKSVADYVRSKVGERGKCVVVVAGTGNNGGDGFVVARHLAGYGAAVKVFLLGSDADIKTEEASRNLRIISEMTRSTELIRVADGDFLEEMRKSLSKADVVVDAIFGTGIRGEIKEPNLSVIEAINRSRAFKVAVDVPSGLDPLTGEVAGTAVKADATVTFHRAKKGLFVRVDLVGELVVANIGIPVEAEEEGCFGPGS